MPSVRKIRAIKIYENDDKILDNEPDNDEPETADCSRKFSTPTRPLTENALALIRQANTTKDKDAPASVK